MIEAVRILWLRIYDFTVDIHGVIILEWWVTGQHLIKKNSKSPPIDSFAMSLIKQNFRSNVLRCAADGICSFCDHFCEAEVYKLQVSIRSNHNIFRFQISIDYFLALQIFKNRDYLSSVECSSFWIEVTNAPMVSK